jgi:hypothetical protein
VTAALPAPTGWRGARWARALAVALVLVVGILAVRHSLGMALAAKRPELALRIDGENAQVQAQAALAVIQGGPEPQRRARARALAERALARDAGNVTALAAYGLASDRPERTAAAFTAAERLSRRSLVTQLWLIESAVAKGDVAQALHHYDIALRTSRAAPAVLFPVLVEATTDDALLPAIARTLAQRPLWGGLYLQQLAQSGPDQGRIATLFALLKRQGVATGTAADAALYDRLVAARMFDDAWKVYAAGQRGARRDAVRNPLFADQPAAPTPFDWQPSDNEFVTARLEQAAPGQGRLVFSTAAGEGGEVVRQLLALPAGDYAVQVDAERIETADAAPPYLRLVCLASGAELLRKPLALQGATAARVAVPAECRGQSLSIVVQPATGLGAVAGTVRSVRLGRAG